MSKIESIKRYHFIIQQLRNKHSTYKEIEQKLKLESAIDGQNYVRDIRTFQRDLNDISTIYGINIECNKKTNTYFIENNDTQNYQYILETLDVAHALQTSQNLIKYISFENRKPAGTQFLLPFLNAIRQKKTVTITHQKFWDSEPIIRNIQPLALKEAQRRWYIVAKEEKQNKIKTFGLDRISEVTITKMKFDYPKDFNVEDFFKNYFGVITNNEKKQPDAIVLSFHPDQKRYLETMPLHHTQAIIKDTKKEYVIQLSVFPTFDLIKEIRSYGNEVKIISPKNLLK